jgi:protein-disulfide isomerase
MTEDSMQLSRRSTLAAVASLVVARTAQAQSADPRMADRAMGSPDAKVVVAEWFSLTCSHCAEFQKSTFPQVKKELIDTGRVRYIWRDYPLDQIALTAAMVARSLPAERYEPFITTLLATQDRWAFARGVNSTEELAKLAALAGMPRASFDAAIGDAALKQAILTAQDEAEKKLSVNSTPSFIINGRLVAGAVRYSAFLQAVDAAQG